MNKAKKTTHNHKHLSLSERIYIEQELYQGTSFKGIASFLGKDPSTISKEVRRNRTLCRGRFRSERCGICAFFDECTIRGSDPHVASCPRTPTCSRLCSRCCFEYPHRFCTLFMPFQCSRCDRFPYVCNHCPDERKCPIQHYLYMAKDAQRKYEKTLVNSRTGINMTTEELQQLNDLVSPLIRKGQPLSHIFAVHKDEIPVCRRTLYNYLDQRIFQARNIDLPRRVRYRKRKKRPQDKRQKNYQQVYRNKRTYKDFERFMEAHPDLDVVEMDTVKGSRTSGKCLLTLLFRSCSFMIIILMQRCDQESVLKAFNSLTNGLGYRLFKKSFPVILTDNGSEFKDPEGIEFTQDGKRRTYVFYCDPYVSNQKGRLEKNHEYIRYVIPKGKSMLKYDQHDISLLASHINSTARDSLNGAAPFDLADLLLDKRIPVLTGQFKVSPDNVLLKPALLDNHRASPG
ncbi:MAG: IS30 family transposase [Firmicutes bacterium]|nr:IS30 family transposase [Bacillota bacterium]